MQRKLNDEFVRSYSEQFSEKITAEFFSEKETISGKEILTVTPSRQVNLFVLKALFQKWQEEMKRLESPFFNYRDVEVRKAMVAFMNTLSQHIEVDGDHFITMLEEAVRDTLRLLSDPGTYIRAEFAEIDAERLNQKLTGPILKYLRLYKEVIREIFDSNHGESMESFLAATSELSKESIVDAELDQQLALLSEVVEINAMDLFEKETQSDVYPPELAEDFVEPEEKIDPIEIGETPDDPEAAESFLDEEGVEEEDVLDEMTESTGVEHEENIEQSDIDIEDSPERESEDSGEDTSTKIEHLEENVEDGNDKQSNREENTVHAKFAQDATTLVDKLQQKPVGTIMDAISVNQRYMFSKELFDGNRDEFQDAMDQMEQCSSFDDAVEILVQDFAKSREWDMNSDEVKELLKVVFRKFR